MGSSALKVGSHGASVSIFLESISQRGGRRRGWVLSGPGEMRGGGAYGDWGGIGYWAGGEGGVGEGLGGNDVGQGAEWCCRIALCSPSGCLFTKCQNISQQILFSNF